jgi:hypothetical protein
MRFCPCFKLIFAVLVAVISGTSILSAEEIDSLIEREFEQFNKRSVWQLGPVGLIPNLGLFAGYDSNSFSTSVDVEPSYTGNALARISAIIPVKKRLLLNIDETLDYRVYNEVQGLDNLYSITSAGAAFGGKVWLITLNESYQEGKRRVNSEVDIPLDQIRNNFNGTFALAFGKQTLNFSYGNDRLSVEQRTVPGRIVEARLGGVRENYQVGLSRQLTEKTGFTVEGFVENRTFTRGILPREDHSVGGRAGFVFSTIGNITGQAILGYKTYRVEQAPEEPVEFSGLIGFVDTQVRVHDRVRLGFFYTRNNHPSVRAENRFFVENRYGGSVQILLLENLTGRVGVILGNNTYPNPVIVINDEGQLEQQELVDDFLNYVFGVSYRLGQNWRLDFGGHYQDRDSTFNEFSTKRFVINAGFASTF